VIRHNRITGDPVLLAPERAGRPDGYRHPIDRCPFCPGHESDTPAEIWRDGDPWTVRVVPNKYPASARHEVIVESPDHDAAFDRLAPGHAALAVETYVRRYRALRSGDGWTCIFKNHGALAGASMPHLHSQVLAVPFVPPRVRREMDAFRATAACLLCDLDDEPLIEETDRHRWIAPRGSSMAFEQWIVPRTHAPEITGENGLAALLQRAVRAVSSVAESFNWIFMNFPNQPAAHWYVQILPRTSMLAGFELGSGSAINAVDPEDIPAQLAPGG